MKYSWIAVLAGLPLIMGAGLPLDRPIPRSQPADVLEVSFLDRLFQEGTPKRASSAQRRGSSSRGRNTIPKPPALTSIPVPIPKPALNSTAQAESVPEVPQQTGSAASKPPVSETPPPVAQNQANQRPDNPPATAPAAEPPVVEQPGTATKPPYEAEVPKPLAKPESVEPATPDEKNAAKPEEAKPDGKESEEDKAETPPPPPPPPLVKENPEELQACLAELTGLGTKFEPISPIDDGNGCGIEHPIKVAEVLPGVELGGAVMRCKTAVAMAHWLKDTTQPAMNIAMPGRKITGIVPGSTYACRLRNGASTGKISEHARGNGIDVAAFKLDNGETMEMKPREDDSTLEGAFQRTATAGACLHFTTVLSPGSDAAHQNHLHLDVMERENGYRYCR
ncbi:extensin family protein [Neorhizobium alkalisoli]|uniref:extensin family protein n=1 Tax=Neorhizobium alkalisoli TaxID=528178 RepID=UPI000CF89DE7|nr:extensin family protein [Neorhizobium alkalisoli]